MSEPKTKARPAAPYDGKPVWHGLYLDGEGWQTVTNAAGLPIAYKTAEAANAAAWLAAP
jgi:hypothetical protein